MGDTGMLPAPKRTLASPEHEELLNIIDKIRSQGISRYIDLPQIIVCGDQSSGKSSCLEAICGLRFPTGDGLCTRFATEYILRRSSESSVYISIVPDTERVDSEKARLQSFKPSTEDLGLFPDIIDEAAKCMGIGQNGKTFSHDVLRIEISGPQQEHLTLVDLPGLFHSASKSHTDGDKDAVFSLVSSYISRPRSIILAVVSAKNDLNNQAVLSFAKKHDPEGTRTLGIITKPDTLSKNSPSEQAYLDLARNADVKFALGWHVLRNRSWEEQDYTAAQRDQKEEGFFNEGNWKALDVKNKGISFLRIRLGKILFDHILKELPSLLGDVEAGIADCQSRLAAMGESRGTLDEQRFYLLRVSQKFVALMTAAVDGVYSDAFFGSSIPKEGFQKRLRAVAITILKDFTKIMNTKGHAVALMDSVPANYVHVPGFPLKTSHENFYQQVQLRMQRNGGRELPGLYNPSIVGDLFFDQAKPWQRIVGSTKDSLLEAAHTAVRHALQHTADEGTIHGILRMIVNPGMEVLEQSLSTKAEEVLRPNIRGHPFTLNHYFTENIQKKRAQQTRKDMGERLEGFLGVSAQSNDAAQRRYEGSFDVRLLLDALVQQSELNMDRFAAIECVNAMLSYYKVASKTVIDAFGMYAVEECLLNKLPGIFTPEIVLRLDSDSIQAIAGESASALIERESLTKKLTILKDTQKILHRLDRHKSKGKSSRSSLPTSGADVQQIPSATPSEHTVSSVLEAKAPPSRKRKAGSTWDVEMDGVGRDPLSPAPVTMPTHTSIWIPAASGVMENMLSITATETYQDTSFEELRLADYNAGRRFGYGITLPAGGFRFGAPNPQFGVPGSPSSTFGGPPATKKQRRATPAQTPKSKTPST